MKLKVYPEGRKNVYLITPANLRSWLDDWFTKNEYMHNYIANDGSRMFIGADWTRPSFEDHIDSPEAKWAVTTSDDGIFAGHRLICVDKVGDRYTRFVFDVGPITEDDLEIGEAQ